MKKELWFIVKENNHIKILKESEATEDQEVYTQGFEDLCEAVKWRNDNIKEQLFSTPQPGEKERKCNWCGGKKNDKGGLLDITIHNECYEGIMNGAGII